MLTAGTGADGVGRRAVSVARWVERAYVVVLMCGLTLGTVTWVWGHWFHAAPADVLPAADWTLVALQLPALALAARRIERLRSWHLPAVLATLLGWLALSTTWSTAPTHTVVQVATLALTCCTGVYLAVSFTSRELLVLVLVAMQPGLVASRIAIERGWPEAVDMVRFGVAGIYGNRNSLGPPAVIGAAFGCVLITGYLRGARRRPELLAAAILVGAVVVFDLDLQHRSSSVTSWMILVTFLGTCAVMAATPLVPVLRRRRRPGVAVGRSVLLVLAVGFIVALSLNRWVSDALGRAPGFSGRLEFWKADALGFRDRPVVGWGWLAAWRSEEFLAQLTPAMATYVWSHSAYMDIALGGGVVAIVLAIGVAYVGSGTAASAWSQGDVASALPVALVAAVAIACTQESFFVGNYFLTALLVAGLCGAQRLPQQATCAGNGPAADVEAEGPGAVPTTAGDRAGGAGYAPADV